MTIQTANLVHLRDLVRKRAAIVLESDKDYLVEARLAPLARSEGFASIDELIVATRQPNAAVLTHKIVEAMTTNETSFFRDVHPWEALKTVILPPLVAARAATKRLRIWCAAASTGQEPYTIAMTIREHFPQLATWDVQILGTDINRTVLDRARSGTYKQLEVNRGLPAPMLVKHFDRVGTEWTVKPEIRKMCAFQELNLLERWTLFGTSDVVFMRNVLIYFDAPTKKDILARVRDKLAPDGYLVLGGAETTLNLDDRYAPMRAGQTVVYQARREEPRKAGTK